MTATTGTTWVILLGLCLLTVHSTARQPPDVKPARDARDSHDAVNLDQQMQLVKDSASFSLRQLAAPIRDSAGPNYRDTSRRTWETYEREQRGLYNQDQPQYDQPHEQYSDHQQQYDRSDQQYDMSYQQYDRSQQQYDRSQQRYDRSQQQYDRSQQQYDRSQQQYDRSQQQYDRSDQQYDRSQQQYDRSQQQYDRSYQQYDRSQVGQDEQGQHADQQQATASSWRGYDQGAGPSRASYEEGEKGRQVPWEHASDMARDHYHTHSWRDATAVADAGTDVQFRQLVISDVQLWWFRGDKRGSDHQAAEESNTILRDSVLAEHAAWGPSSAGLVVNGDLTAFGHGNEWDTYTKIWGFRSDLRVSVPLSTVAARLGSKYYQGLGNHDITNSLPLGCSGIGWPEYYGPYDNMACAINPTCCATRMLSMQQRMLEREPPEGFLSLSPAGAAYSWKRDKFRFVMLNLNPYLDAEVALNAFYKPKLGPYMDWFEDQLKEAKTLNQFVVVFIHTLVDVYPEGGSKDLWQDARFSAALINYPVSIIFHGHDHAFLGQRRTLQGVPVVWSGAAEMLSYLDVGYGAKSITIAAKVARRGPSNIVVGTWQYILDENTGKPINPTVGLAWEFSDSPNDTQLEQIPV